MKQRLKTLNKQNEKSDVYKDILTKNRDNLIAIMEESYVSPITDPDRAACDEIIHNTDVLSESRDEKYGHRRRTSHREERKT